MDIKLYLIDIILLVLCVFFAALAAKKGFTRAALDFVFSVIGTAASWFVANTFCGQIYQLLIRERLLQYINDKIITKITGTVDSAISAVPGWITDSAVKLGIFDDTADIAAGLTGNITAESLEQSFLGPVATFIVKAVVFVLLAAILGIILRIVSHAIGKAVRKSSAKGVDIALGAVLGIFKGVVVSLIISVLLYSIGYLIPDSEFVKFVDASYFCKISVALLNLL